MGLWEVLLLLVVAGVCGAVGQAITGYTRAGCLVSVALGFIGALIGMWLQRLLMLPDLLTLEFSEGMRFPVVWSILGATLFVALIGLLTRERARP